MGKCISRMVSIFLIVSVVALAGCSDGQQAYQKAFNSQYGLTQNHASFPQSSEAVFKIVKQTLTQQGFAVDTADLKSGVVKATRNMADKSDSEISYNIQVYADITEVPGAETNVTLAGNQQTILRRSTRTWWHLLWILPIIPTGTEYQTLVIAESNITDPGFYADFFNSLKSAVAKYDTAAKAAAAKAAAEKAEAERIAAETAARLKAEAEAKMAAERAEAERIAAERAARLRAEAEAKVAAERAAAERAAAERAAAEKAAAERAAAEAAVLKTAASAKAVTENTVAGKDAAVK